MMTRFLMALAFVCGLLLLTTVNSTNQFRNNTQKMENIKDYQQHLRGYDYTGKTPVVIDFYATWCGPCRTLSPRIEQLAKEYEGHVAVLKVDVDKNQALAQAANIMSIPTVFFITKDGNITRSVGVMSYDDLKKAVDKLLE